MQRVDLPPNGGGVTSLSTVDRAIDVLTVLAESDRGLSNAEVSSTLDLDRSTCHRLLTTLERRAVVTRDGTTKRFRPGPYLTYLAMAGAPDARLVVHEELRSLVELSGESASFSLLAGNHFHCVAHLRCGHELSYSPVAGRSYPLQSAAAGLALWAFQDDRLAERLVEEVAQREPSLDVEALRRELADTVARGYARSAGTRSPGGCSIAVPVLDRNGVARGVLTLSAAAERLPLEELEQLVAPLRESAERLARTLHWSDAEGGHRVA